MIVPIDRYFIDRQVAVSFAAIERIDLTTNTSYELIGYASKLNIGAVEIDRRVTIPTDECPVGLLLPETDARNVIEVAGSVDGKLIIWYYVSRL